MKQCNCNLVSVFVFASAACAFHFSAAASLGDSLMYIADGSGTLGTVDIMTGEVNVIGEMGLTITDIAFDPNGDLFGIGYFDLFRIDIKTAAVSRIGTHGIRGSNSLTFDRDGTLYAASYTSTSLYSLNLNTGGATTVGNIGFESEGDLAFLNGQLFMAGRMDALVELDLDRGGAGTVIGPLGVVGMLGLGSANGVLYGTRGRTIYTIDTSTGWATSYLEWESEELGGPYGAAFLLEAVPAPGAIGLLSMGIFIKHRRRKR